MGGLPNGSVSPSNGKNPAVLVGDSILYLGDCWDIISGLPAIDAVVTDPPYGIGERMNGGTWGAAEKYADFRAWDVAPSDDRMLQLRELAPSVIIWGGNHFAMPRSRCWLIWDKQNAVPTMADFEMAWTNLDQPAKRFRHPVGNHEWGHPTEKPLPLMGWCLDQLPATARVVFDPFMGSGTTGVACVRRGEYKFIGVERDPIYFEIALRRIVDEYKQMRFSFIEPETPSAAKQLSLGMLSDA